MQKVTLYSTPTCEYCRMAKIFFKKHKVKYKNIDVSYDDDAISEIVEKTGQIEVPVIIVSNDDKEEAIVGFDQDRIERALRINMPVTGAQRT